MKTVSFFVLCLAFSTALSAQNFVKQDYLQYYAGIAKPWKETVPKLQQLWGQCESIVLNAQKSRDHKADPAAVDNLKRSYADNISDLNRAILTAGSFDETDADLNYKKTVVDFFNDAKTIEQAAMPQFFAVLANGVDKPTPQQEMSLKIFLSKLEDLHQRSFAINNLGAQFCQRHGITADDLSNFGLK